MKQSKIIFTLLIILLSSIILVQPVISQENNNNLSWPLPFFDDKSTSFNPQNDLNKDNVATLHQTWMTALSQSVVIFGNETTRTTSSPLLVNGVVYFIDRSQLLFAVKANDNSILWTAQLSVHNNEKYDVGTENVHMRFISFYKGTIWLIDLDCSIIGFNAYNGERTTQIPPETLCGDIPKESNPRNSPTRIISAPILYKQENILIVSPSGLETNDRSLSYILGINLETNNIAWKTSLVTSIEENVAHGGGQWSIDQEEGIVYIGTGSPIPEWNATFRSGANTYSNSIIAIDASNGEIIWNYQTNPHDINGYGCTGNTVLGEIDGKKAIYAACKNGYLYALDAESGDLIWYFNPPILKRINSENADFVKTNNYDPNKLWINYPSTETVIQCPGVFGAVSYNIALGYNTIYMTAFNRCSKLSVAPITNIGDTGVTDISILYEPIGPMNSTLYAIDASNGEIKWNKFFDEVALMGGLTVSGGLVYLPSPDGNVYAFDSETGSQIWKSNFGSLGVYFPPIIGATANGTWSVIQIVAGTPQLHSLGEYSGYLFSLIPDSDSIDNTIEKPTEDVADYNLIITYSAIAVTIILLTVTAVMYYRRRKT